MKYNVLDEVAWIPASTVDGDPVEVTLEEAFLRSYDLGLVCGDTAMQTASILRVMCAAAIAADAVWVSDTGCGIDVDKIVDRLRRYRDRFWLVHDTAPFGQVRFSASEVDLEPRTVTVIDPIRASWGDHTLWDHRSDDDVVVISPSQAARQLMRIHAAASGGITKGPHVSPGTTMDRSAGKSPLTEPVCVFAVGASLAETVAMGCLGAARVEGDKPVWEQEVPGLVKEPRDPAGPCDWLTYSSRRVELFPSSDGEGFSHAVIRPGFLAYMGADQARCGVEPHVMTRVTKTIVAENMSTVGVDLLKVCDVDVVAGMLTRGSVPGIEATVSYADGQATNKWWPEEDSEKVEVWAKKFGSDSSLVTTRCRKYVSGLVQPSASIRAYHRRFPDRPIRVVCFWQQTSNADYLREGTDWVEVDPCCGDICEWCGHE